MRLSRRLIQIKEDELLNWEDELNLLKTVNATWFASHVYELKL